MQVGQLVTVEIEGRTLRGVIELVSENGRSAAVSIDEGVPVPFHVHPDTGKQVLLVLVPDGIEPGETWVDIVGRAVTIRP